MARRRCKDCPRLIPATAYKGRCTDCARTYDQARGTRQERGYDAEHDRLRADYRRRIEAGETLSCIRCGLPITDKATPDHTSDRLGYLGPAHTTCNLRAAGKARLGISPDD